MALDEAFETALRSEKPFQALRDLISNLSSKGLDAQSILAQFEAAREQLRHAGHEADEDMVMDAMDCLVGWCRPEMVLPRSPNSDAVTRVAPANPDILANKA